MGANKTVLVLTTNAVGHIHSTLAIADKLKKDHNYRTVFMTIGPTIGIIKDHGHELIEVEENHGGEERAGSGETTTRLLPGHKKWPENLARGREAFSSGDAIATYFGVMNLIVKVVARELIQYHDAIEREIEKVDPDLILIDYVAAPVCVIKNQHRCPWVNVRSLQPLGVMKAARVDGIKPPAYLGTKLYTKEERNRMASEEAQQWESLLKSWKDRDEIVRSGFSEALKELSEFFHSKGLEFNPGMHSMSPFLNIYNYPEALDYDKHDDDLLVYPPGWLRCGTLVRQPIGCSDSREIQLWSRKLDEAMRNKTEMIYFSLGSIASGQEDLIRKYIDFLKDDHERLYVVSKGANGDKFELNANNMIGANYLPQTFFLERAKLAIIHGGNNGVAECMYHGVPMIVLPMFGDQLDNAQRVQDLGLGCRLNLYHCSKQELRDSIERLTSDSELAGKLRSISERMQSCDDLDRVSVLLKSLIDNKRVDDKLT